MVPSTLSRDLLSLSAGGKIAYINRNRSAIRSMFLIEWDSKVSKRDFIIVLQTLCDPEFSTAQSEGIEVQSLMVHLAYYFKRIDAWPYLSTCYSKIINPYFRFRLEAIMKLKKYHSFDEHKNQFTAYLDLLVLAQDYVDDGNYNELLNDLDEYLGFARSRISEESISSIEAMINDDGFQNEYPLIRQYQERVGSILPDLGVLPYDGSEYEPSVFADGLFNEKFLTDIKTRSTPGFPQRLLGFPSAQVTRDIIGRGQTDFDAPFVGLEADDRVNLYCYFNMRMHFFSSLSLYNRSQVFEKYYHSGGKIRFVDIGCGPATSGVAFVDYLNAKSDSHVVFDYFGIDSSEKMKEKAAIMLDNDCFVDTNNRLFFSEVNEIDASHFKNSACIIINCSYVFASPSLPYTNIANYINELCVIYPYIPVYLMYQNVASENLNLSYLAFKRLLTSFKVEWSQIEKIRYHTQRNPFYGPKEREVYYEILKLS